MPYLLCWPFLIYQGLRGQSWFCIVRVELEAPNLVVFLAAIKYMDLPLWSLVNLFFSGSFLCLLHIYSAINRSLGLVEQNHDKLASEFVSPFVK